MAENNEKILVAVTGASGYVGSRVCYKLLKRNYKVRAFVRDPNNQASVGHLKTMIPEKSDDVDFGVIENLSEPPANLSSRLEGCTYLIHCASPVLMGDVPEDQVVKPAVEGTKKVMEAALEAGVRRVVLTASLASICGTQTKKNPAHIFTEKDWNDEMGTPYSKSKTLAEKAAWEFVEKNPSLELVTIHPSLVLGPVLSSRLTSTSAWISNILKGDFINGAPVFAVATCNVLDVSEAHVVAMTHEKAAGERFLVSHKQQYSVITLSNLIKECLPSIFSAEQCKEFEAKLPTKYMGDKEPVLKNDSVDSSKIANVMGIHLKTPKETVEEQLRCLVEMKLV